MEVVVTTGAISRAKLQSNHHHQQTNIQFFYRPDALPVAQPTVSKHWREKDRIPWTCLPKLTWGLPTLSLNTNSSWLPWGRVAMPLTSPQVSEELWLTRPKPKPWKMRKAKRENRTSCLTKLVCPGQFGQIFYDKWLGSLSKYCCASHLGPWALSDDVHLTSVWAPCGLRGCKNWPAPFPGRMSYKATKPGLAFVLCLSMFIIVFGVY